MKLCGLLVLVGAAAVVVAAPHASDASRVLQAIRHAPHQKIQELSAAPVVDGLLQVTSEPTTTTEFISNASAPELCVPGPQKACEDLTGLGPCMGRGQCCEGGKSCQCNYGYTGDHCEISLFASCPRQCSGHGLACVNNTCRCQPGFTGRDCSRVVACEDLNFCSGHGLCVDSACECDAGWEGVDCATLVSCPNDCSGRGLCNHNTRECLCDAGFTGNDCGTAVTEHCPSACSGHGQCDHPTRRCQCDLGHAGYDCQQAHDPCPCRRGKCVVGEGDAPYCECPPGWTGDQCHLFDAETAPCASGDAAFCSGHGLCSQSGTCTCSAGYVSSNPIPPPPPPPPPSNSTKPARVAPAARRVQNCGVVAESPCESSCSGHGKCRDHIGQCRCRKGWEGADCATSLCPTTDNGVCDSRGVCEFSAVNDTVSFHCTCDPGYTGHDCSSAVPQNSQPAQGSCPNECSQNGVCVNDVCDCFEGWGGDDCSEYNSGAAPNENAVDANEFA